MELDHDSGAMDGDILVGPFTGRKLSSLSDGELHKFMEACAAARDQSLALLQAWMDRSKPGWRGKWSGPAGSERVPVGGAMSAKEARQVLGLGEAVTEEQIRAAHRNLMKQFHPDRGGSDYLAAKINEAKDVLLQELGART
jgi:hypothetical protein